MKKIDPKDRIGALENAKDYPFDAIELVGLCIALVLVVFLTRYSAAELGIIGRVGAALANRWTETGSRFLTDTAPDTGSGGSTHGIH